MVVADTRLVFSILVILVVGEVCNFARALDCGWRALKAVQWLDKKAEYPRWSFGKLRLVWCAVELLRRRLGGRLGSSARVLDFPPLKGWRGSANVLA